MNQWKEENDCINYFMIILHESMEPGRDQTRDPWNLQFDWQPIALRGSVREACDKHIRVECMNLWFLFHREIIHWKLKSFEGFSGSVYGG